MASGVAEGPSDLDAGTGTAAQKVPQQPGKDAEPAADQEHFSKSTIVTSARRHHQQASESTGLDKKHSGQATSQQQQLLSAGNSSQQTSAAQPPHHHRQNNLTSLSAALDKSNSKDHPKVPAGAPDSATQSQPSVANSRNPSVPKDDSNLSARPDQKQPAKTSSQDPTQQPIEQTQAATVTAPPTALAVPEEKRVPLKPANQRAASIAVDSSHLSAINKLNFGMTQGRFGGKAG